jgi:hypothetical protein
MEQFYVSAALVPQKQPRVFGQVVGEPQSRSGRRSEEKICQEYKEDSLALVALL